MSNLSQFLSMPGVKVLASTDFEETIIGGGPGGCLASCREAVDVDCGNNTSNPDEYAACQTSGHRTCAAVCSL